MTALDCTVVTLFPQWVQSVAGIGVVGRAVTHGMATLDCVNPRDFARDRHRTVDDRPYGGGPGMVMKPEPLHDAVSAIKGRKPGAYVICSSPQGKVFNNREADHLLALQRPLIMICGRYEGVDERFIELCVDKELSLGDFVLSGGELACMAMFDALVRKLPGALGHDQSAVEDSFVDDRLDYPHYTRPDSFQGLEVPKVLKGGDHGEIARWRAAEAKRRTRERRPDLLSKAST